MNVYFIMLCLVSFFLFVFRYSRTYKNKKKCAVLIAFILIVIAGLRYKVGTDYTAYIMNYEKYKNADILELKYAGVYLIARLACLLNDDYATWFFLMSVLTIGGAVYSIFKYSSNFPFSILLYLFIGCWHNSFNVVKQCAAVTILLFGLQYIFDRKFLKWGIVCLVASSFHISAVLMIPIYFLVTREIGKKQIFLLIVIAFAVSLSYDRLMALMSSLKSLDSIDASKSVTTRNVNILRVLVNFAPVLLMLFFCRNMKKEDAKFKVLANFALLNAFLYLANMGSVYLTRFCLYTEVYNTLFIPCVISKSKIKSNKEILTILCCAFYFVFWLYDLSKGSTTATFHWIFER